MAQRRRNTLRMRFIRDHLSLCYLQTSFKKQENATLIWLLFIKTKDLSLLTSHSHVASMGVAAPLRKDDPPACTVLYHQPLHFSHCACVWPPQLHTKIHKELQRPREHTPARALQ